jgi:hypothetical protein
MSDVIYLSDCRLSFPNLAEPQKQRNEQTGAERISYNCELIMPRDHQGYAQFMQVYARAIQGVFKEHANSVMQMIQNDRKSRCFGAGEEKVNKKTFQPYDGYPGMVFITAGSKNPPQVIQGDGTPVDPTNTMAYQALARKLYGGCRVNAAVKPWVQKNSHGNGIRCDLIAIQFLRDDKPFGEGAVDVSGMFGATQAAPAAVPGFAATAPAMPAPPMFGAAPPAFAAPKMPWQ